MERSPYQVQVKIPPGWGAFGGPYRRVIWGLGCHIGWFGQLQVSRPGNQRVEWRDLGTVVAGESRSMRWGGGSREFKQIQILSSGCLPSCNSELRRGGRNIWVN